MAIASSRFLVPLLVLFVVGCQSESDGRFVLHVGDPVRPGFHGRLLSIDSSGAAWIELYGQAEPTLPGSHHGMWLIEATDFASQTATVRGVGFCGGVR